MRPKTVSFASRLHFFWRAVILGSLIAVLGLSGPGLAQAQSQPAAKAQKGKSGEAQSAAGVPALTSAQRARQTRVYVQGDSLTVGAAPYLRRMLKGRVKGLSVDAHIGRHTSTGLSRTRGSASARRAGVWVMALGTNDAPSPRTVKRQVRQSLRLAGRNRSVIWVTLVRPGGYESVNRMLRKYAQRQPRLHVVDWAKQTQQNRSVLAGDRVHATSEGYRIRAAMIAREAQVVAGQQ